MNTRSKIFSQGKALLLGLFWALLVTAGTWGAQAQTTDADPLTPYRQRFQQGLDRFRDGDVAGALQYWEPIRRELGDAQAYRLLFNIGKAYETLGDGTLAAERYESFIRIAKAQTTPVAEIVQENLREAEQRLSELKRTRGRIRVVPSEHPGLVQIDGNEPRLGAFTAYVAPGTHSITLDPGTAQQTRSSVQLSAGAEVVFDPSRKSPPSAGPVATEQGPGVPNPPLPVVHTETQRPFSPVLLYTAGGVTAVSLLAPALTYRHAKSISDQYNEPETSPERRRVLYDDYQSARRMYNWSWGLPALCLVGTGALTVWYVKGSQVQVLMQPSGSQSHGMLGVQGSF